MSAPTRILHIGVSFNSTKPRDEARIKLEFEKSLDWLRYAENCWLVHTNMTPSGWSDRLRPALNEEDTVLIFEILPTIRHGFAHKFVWDWLAKYDGGVRHSQSILELLNDPTNVSALAPTNALANIFNAGALELSALKPKDK